MSLPTLHIRTIIEVFFVANCCILVLDNYWKLIIYSINNKINVSYNIRISFGRRNIEWLHLRHNYQKYPYARTFGRYRFVNKGWLHTTSIISPIILSLFTMSKVTKNVNQMCSSITNVQKRPTTFCQGMISRKKMVISGGENLYELGPRNTDEKTASSHHKPWHRELPTIYTKSIHCWWPEELVYKVL